MKNTKITKQINITRVKDNNKFLIKDTIIDEDILQIYINGDKNFEMVFSMTKPVELTAGFLFTQDIISKKTDIEKITFDNLTKQCHVILNRTALKRLDEFKTKQQIKGSSGGTLLQGTDLSPKSDNNKSKHNKSDHKRPLNYNKVLSLITMHQEQSELFQQTGAVHSAGLCTSSKILSFYEDIGRHNAIDKLAGDILLNSINTYDKIATLSCRMSLEIIGKIIKTCIPIVISNAAPTLSAIKLADQAGLTVIGFARGNRFNIYTHEHRICHR
ncbi:formate dehydrogenase accessory sulfurtransferase FdhD [bacterium]|nr:formate dehydrogenase accessory sulfurtransferase FdhD [bacterium]